MGNTATKEARSSLGPSGRHGHLRGSSGSAVDTANHSRQQQSEHSSEHPYSGGSSSRHRGSRPDLSFLGIGPSSERSAPSERRETKHEREARRLERERAARLKERERSMREEHVDGGYLVTQGVYTGVEDFNKPIVRQLMIERRLAPFWKGLEDFSESWTEHQLMAAARGLPIPAPDEIPPELEYKLTPQPPEAGEPPERNLNNLTVPISSRSQSYNSDTSSGTHPISTLLSSLPVSPGGSSSPGTHLFRGRAKTLASLTSSSKANSPVDMAPRELQLPKDPFVNGQPIEAYLYKNPTECPICFLYYPPYLNKTRCCDQPMCSECFVQIKRADPHPPEHEQRDANSTAPPPEETDGQLVSEPSACPFCVQPEFGVSYTPPPFRRGLSYIPSHSLHTHIASPTSSTSSLASGGPVAQQPTTRRRATSLSANSPSVITTDRIRPDWSQKLNAARAHAARRSAAATALHTAAYLMNNSESSRGGSSSRRGMLRRAAGHDSPTTTSPSVSSLAILAERRAIIAERDNDPTGEGRTNLAPERGSSRRTRVEDLEEMMMMEAIRLSLASEEERRKKEEKEAKKAAKRREKEAKKAEKYARKNGLYSNNPSSAALDTAGSSTIGRMGSGPPSITTEETSSSKGKGVDRPKSPIPPPPDPPAQGEPQSPGPPKLNLPHSNDDEFSSIFGQSSASATKRSHLRHISSASSSNSSLVESASSEQIGSGTLSNASNSAIEPLLGFRSLAAVMGDEDKGSSSGEHVEDMQQEAKPNTDSTPSIDSIPALASDQIDPVTEEVGPSHSKDEQGLEQKELPVHPVNIIPVRNMETAG
ncbi:SNF1-interacting protein [Onygenales sp. PD_10]|nr:SNF1-interacting protein [Onygenales sp. PD_10]